MTYNDLQSAKAVVAFEQKMGLAGVFVYSADMDTKDYQMMNGIADALVRLRTLPRWCIAHILGSADAAQY